MGLIPESGRSPGGGHGNPLPGESQGQRTLEGYSHGVARSQTQLKRPSKHTGKRKGQNWAWECLRTPSRK